MAMYRRGTSLRESFLEVLLKRSTLTCRVQRLKGNYLFRAAARLVLQYIDWLVEEQVVEEISDDVAVNIRMAQQKKVEKKALTLEDRSILLTRPTERTGVDKTYIYELFNKFHAFRKYPEDLRESLAGVCLYQYLQPGRVIVRQGRKAENLYFIINGEVSLSRTVTDRWTDESKEIDMGILTAGDIFGEIALLHEIPRTATVISKTTADLFLIPERSFNMVLRRYLSSEWDILQDALVHFNYFETWDKDTVRECCILSRMKDFRPDEVILGDGKGMVNYVHFVLEGECRLIEHMNVHEEVISNGNVRYELYNPRISESIGKSESIKGKIYKKDQIDGHDGATDDHASAMELLRMTEQSKLLAEQIDHDRSSTITTTLLDVVHEWHKITDVVEILMRPPSTISQQCYPKGVRTIFMQICTFERGACFGLGENMRNRRIVSTTNVRCFLVPRYFLNEHNRANIWEHVKLFMDSKYPTRKELFDKFVQDRNAKVRFWDPECRPAITMSQRHRGNYHPTESSVGRAAAAGSSREAYDILASDIRSSDSKRTNRGRGSSARQRFQRSRVDKMREDKGAIGASDLAKALQTKLYPGVTSGQAAADRLEAISTLKALCVTTRSMGFGSIHVFIALYDLHNVPISGDIYQLYRVSLAIFEAKVQACQENTNMIVDNLDDLQVLNNSADFIICRARTILPDPMSRAVNAIGNVKLYDSVYYPRIAANRDDNLDRFIPQSEHVLFSNLRETVVALADNAPSRLEHRRRFHENNPIPGCIWGENHVLLNPDEIMPGNYNTGVLTVDMDDVQSKITFLARKSPKYFTEAINYGSEGSKAMLSSNFQSGMKIRDRNRNEPLMDYYRRARVDGDILSFENLQRLTGAEQISATLSLLGERPATASAMYPVYVNRDPRCCVESSPMSYKAARSITYTNT